MLTYGFFNSVNNDRVYNADQLWEPFSRIISNGIFPKSGQPSDDLKVKPTGSGLNVKVSIGMAILNYKWVKNDSDYLVNLPAMATTGYRIDSVVITYWANDRNFNISVVQGQRKLTLEECEPPELTDNQYRLCNIIRNQNQTTITDDEITDTRATEIGFIINLLDNNIDITSTWTQWQQQFNDFLETLQHTVPKRFEKLKQRHTTTTGRTYSLGAGDWSPADDVVEVYLNGLHLEKDEDYEIQNPSGRIKWLYLNFYPDAGNILDVVIYKAFGIEPDT